MQKEKEPSTVYKETKQGGDVPKRAEPSVWTERMLTALEKGVKGGKWFSLMDKVYSENNLQAAYQQVKLNGGSAGVDRVTLDMFGVDIEANIRRLKEELSSGTYEPQAILRAYIPKTGSEELRPLGIPTVRDRIVQTALRNVIEPIFERDFAEHSYGFRPGRGCKDALRQTNKWLQGGNCWVVDVDLKGYFDSIPHERLMEKVSQKIADGKVLNLIQTYLEQQVLDGLHLWTPETGTPQGAVISPLLANIYLNELDHIMAQSGFKMVRYADDMVVLCKTESEAQNALNQLEQWVKQAQLELHPTKTKLVNLAQYGQGFDFLGYHFARSRKNKIVRWPRKQSENKFRDKVRKHTRRTNGFGMQSIIAKLNPILRGYFNYFQHSVENALKKMDGWVRMRLRSILRKRHRLKGCGRGRDHQRWPNAYFDRLGLFCLTQARLRVLSIPSGVNH